MDEPSKNDPNQIIEWQSLEYRDRNRSSDWFWSLGTIALCGAIISVAMSNLLFALIIIIAAFAIYLFETRPPQLIFYQLTKKGLLIGRDLYVYDKMDHFWIDDENKDGIPDLMIHYNRPLFPRIHISLDNIDSLIIRNWLKTKITEKEEVEKTFSEHVADWFGF